MPKAKFMISPYSAAVAPISASAAEPSRCPASAVSVRLYSCCKRLEQNSGIENCSTRRNGSPWVISSTRLLCAVAIM